MRESDLFLEVRPGSRLSGLARAIEPCMRGRRASALSIHALRASEFLWMHTAAHHKCLRKFAVCVHYATVTLSGGHIPKCVTQILHSGRLRLRQPRPLAGPSWYQLQRPCQVTASSSKTSSGSKGVFDILARPRIVIS